MPTTSTSIRAFIQRHPAASYFVLAFLISWGGILAVIRGGAIPAPPEEAQRLFVLVYLAMLAGPSLAGLAVTAITRGKPGLADFRRRLLEWRVGWPWYAVALMAAPLALLIAVLFLSPASAEFVPNVLRPAGGAGPIVAEGRGAFLLMGLLVGIGAGFFEELGWTGVAIPNLRQRYGLVTTGVLVGLVWGAWHFLAIFWGSASALGPVPMWLYLIVALFSFLVPFRVLMVWVYYRTRSLLVSILMHASLTASMLILGPAVMGSELLMFDLSFAAVLWLFVGLAAWAPQGVRRGTARRASQGIAHKESASR